MIPSDVDDDAIEAMVVDALERLPEPFRQRLGSVAIVIEDEADAAQLASVGARGLFGLYQGIPRTRLSADAAPAPSKITIFRGPLVRASPGAGCARRPRLRDRVSRDRPPLRDLRRTSPGAQTWP